MGRQLGGNAVVIVLGPSHLLPHDHQLCVMLSLHPVETVNVEVEPFDGLVALDPEITGLAPLPLKLCLRGREPTERLVCPASLGLDQGIEGLDLGFGGTGLARHLDHIGLQARESGK